MTDQALKILVVEDNVGDVRLLREMFRGESPGSFELTHLLRMSEAETYLAKGGVDIILLDMGLPDGHGLDTVMRARAAAPDVPLIVLTGLDDEALAAEAMTHGAQDYLIKGQIESRALPRALRHAIDRHRLQAETDLIQTQQIEFKDNFLSQVSHELRSPLTAIRQFVTILLDGLAGELNPEQREYMEIVLKNVGQLRSMINDLFDVSAMQAGKLKVDLQCTSLSDAVAYAVDTLQKSALAKGIALSSDIEPELPSVCGDPIRIRQILVILGDNAIKFTPANGTVKIRVRVSDEDPGFLQLEVADSGCGVAADMTERIFDRLFQVPDPALEERKGLGLGLYICRELVTRQAGKIWVKNGPEHGSVFSVTLPIISLSRLIAPAFEEVRQTEPLFTLVATEIGSHTGWLSDTARAEIRDLLQGCLRSDRDILLPKMEVANTASEFFFILAMTDGIGGEAISKRIRQQLSHTEHLQQAGLIHSTSYHSIDAMRRDATESKKELLSRVTTRIEELMNEHTQPRQIVNA